MRIAREGNGLKIVRTHEGFSQVEESWRHTSIVFSGFVG
jgi:hypothetical protein